MNADRERRGDGYQPVHVAPLLVHTTGTPRPGITGRAWHSPAGERRYRLRWDWAPGRVMVFIGLNPSTANAFTTDHTAHRGHSFAVREGCGAMVWLNLVPLITPYPADLRRALAADPHDPPRWQAVNDRIIAETLTGAELVVCAWGGNAGHWLIEPHRWHVTMLLQRLRVVQHTLGLTAGGHPAHPLRLPADTPLTEFWPHCQPRP